MRHRLLTLLAAASLLLCLATAGLWVRSYFMGDIVQLYRSIRWVDEDTGHFDRLIIFQVHGRLQFRIETRTFPAERLRLEMEYPRFQYGRANIYPERAGNTAWHRSGFGYSVLAQSDPPYNRDQRLYLPHWFLMVLLAPAPVAWLLRHRKAREIARRQRRGLCLHCGYDLRAPHRCPECGTIALSADSPEFKPESPAER